MAKTKSLSSTGINRSVKSYPYPGAAFQFEALLVDDLDNPAGVRIDEHGMIVYNRVSIVVDTIFRRNIVVGHAGFRQNGTHSDLLIIVV